MADKKHKKPAEEELEELGRDEKDEEALEADIVEQKAESHRRVGFFGFLRDSWAELKRVQWPDRRQVGQATGVVVGFVAIAGGYLGLLDVGFQRLIESIL